MSGLYIRWTDENELGIPIIDEQHRGIVAAINTLYHLQRAGDVRNTVGPTIRIIENCTALHFRTEEALLRDSDYPAIEQHMALHRKLLHDTRRVGKEALQNHDISLVLRFLKRWWITHINEEDRRYAAPVKKALGL